MTATPAEAAHPVLAAAEALRATLVMARALSEAGRRIDLAGLDRETASLCAAAQLLPTESGQLVRPALESLLNEVQVLSLSLAHPS